MHYVNHAEIRPSERLIFVELNTWRGNAIVSPSISNSIHISQSWHNHTAHITYYHSPSKIHNFYLPALAPVFPLYTIFLTICLSYIILKMYSPCNTLSISILFIGLIGMHFTTCETLLSIPTPPFNIYIIWKSLYIPVHIPWKPISILEI